MDPSHVDLDKVEYGVGIVVDHRYSEFMVVGIELSTESYLTFNYHSTLIISRYLIDVLHVRRHC